MPLDSKRVADRLRGGKLGAFPEKEAAASDPDKGSEGSAGQMLIDAVNAGDATAVEEAIQRCVAKKY